MSLGNRSGVHCKRLKVRPSEAATARASMVLPVPGTSSRRTCPSHSSATISSSMVARLPTMTRSTLSMTVSAKRWTCRGFILTPRPLIVPDLMGSCKPSRVGAILPFCRLDRGPSVGRAPTADTIWQALGTPRRDRRDSSEKADRPSPAVIARWRARHWPCPLGRRP